MQNTGDEKRTQNREWVRFKDIIRGSVIVRITRLNAYRPRYSIEVGRYDEGNDKVARHFVVWIDSTEDGKVALRESLDVEIGAALKEANEFIRDTCAQREEEIHEEKIRRESQNLRQRGFVDKKPRRVR